ncbi:MAG TPA: hypothetical protein VNT55_06045, partial [Baekduia sp.]|nr:hypothetical protein [Baekduia sp.]
AITAILVTMALNEGSPAVLATCVIVAGAFLGVINTVLTEAVMKVSPVRPVASSAYSFMRFAGGAIAPFLAGKLSEHVNAEAPLFVGAAAVALGVVLLWACRSLLAPRRAVTPEQDAEAWELELAG